MNTRCREWNIQSDAGILACDNFLAGRDARLTLKLGHDDPIRAWLNGKQIADFPENAGYEGKTLKLKLRKGSNDLLIKVANGMNQNWSAFALSMDFPNRKGIIFDDFSEIPAAQEYARCPESASPKP